jgi:phenylacetate-CoA ligase
MTMTIPLDRLERNPCLTEAGYRMLQRIQQHPHAPVWNYTVGDRVRPADLVRADAFRTEIREQRADAGMSPPPGIIDWVRQTRDRSPLFAEHLPEGFDLEKDWAFIPTMIRDDVAIRPEAIVPWDADLKGLIVYDTSGTTGHALVVPWHPGAVALNHPLLEYALGRYGVSIPMGPDRVAAVCISARAVTVTFSNVFAVWDNAGFAKINFHKQEWRKPDDARKFLEDLNPAIVTGDPVGFAEMMAWGVDIRPAALVSTAVTLGAGLKARLEAYFGCPAIDWYSTTETGPVAYACPSGFGLHVLPPDIFVETVDAEGFPVPAGTRGEIAVTGGRNPYLPLLRYRTGDYGVLNREICPCGDPMPRLMDLEGRAVVLFRTAEGNVVNQVDIGRVLRETLFVQHRFIQRSDGSCDVAIRPAPGTRVDPDRIEELLRRVFGPATPIRIAIDEHLGRDHPAGKVIPYASELVI